MGEGTVGSASGLGSAGCLPEQAQALDDHGRDLDGVAAMRDAIRRHDHRSDRGEAVVSVLRKQRMDGHAYRLSRAFLRKLPRCLDHGAARGDDVVDQDRLPIPP